MSIAINDSYGRVATNSKFLDRFYDIFLKSHPAIAPLFVHTDFTKQKALLRAGISMVVMHADPAKAVMSTSALTRIGASHGPKGTLNIPHSFYRYWIESLLQALKECDPEWTSDLEHEWRGVLKKGVDFIIKNG